MANGLPHHAAVRAARAEMGSAEAIKDLVRDVGWETHFEAFVRDIRYGVRSLVRAPRFTVPSLLTLALGIGATAAMFSVLGAVLLEPLPYHDPDRVVAVWETNRGGTRPQRNCACELCRMARTRPHPRPSRHGRTARTRDHAQRAATASERPDRVLRRLPRTGRAAGAGTCLHRRRRQRQRRHRPHSRILAARTRRARRRPGHGVDGRWRTANRDRRHAATLQHRRAECGFPGPLWRDDRASFAPRVGAAARTRWRDCTMATRSRMPRER